MMNPTVEGAVCSCQFEVCIPATDGQCADPCFNRKQGKIQSASGGHQMNILDDNTNYLLSSLVFS